MKRKLATPCGQLFPFQKGGERVMVATNSCYISSNDVAAILLIKYCSVSEFQAPSRWETRKLQQ